MMHFLREKNQATIIWVGEALYKFCVRDHYVISD